MNYVWNAAKVAKMLYDSPDLLDRIGSKFRRVGKVWEKGKNLARDLRRRLWYDSRNNRRTASRYIRGSRRTAKNRSVFSRRSRVANVRRRRRVFKYR